MKMHVFRHNNLNIILLLIGAILLLGLSSAVEATDIFVTSTADSGPGSLRETLNSAVDADTIDATGISGTIVLTSGELVVSKSVTILGPGPDNLTVDGNAPATTNSVFHIINGVTAAISGLTISNGGQIGIYNDHSTLTISNCMVSGNSTMFGAGIFNDGQSGSAMVTVTSSTIADNTASGYGGGIYNFGLFGAATLIVSNCTFSGNSATASGGAIINDGRSGVATTAITTSNLSGNHVGGKGGAIYNQTDSAGSANLTIIASTLDNNRAGGDGGAINNDHGAVTVITSTLSANHAGFFGGGGAIYNDGSHANGATGSALLLISASTINGNTANFAGGIYNDGLLGGIAILEIGDTILSSNTSVQTYCSANLCSGFVTSIGYNLCSDDCTSFLTATGDQINTDPLLGPLQDNGGPTFTHAPLAGSPALDQGKRDTLPILARTTDQRGLPRIVDDPMITNASGGDGSDIGALELQTVTNRPPVSICTDVTVGADASCQATPSIDDGSYDPDGDPITCVQTPPGPYPLGETSVTLTCTDTAGETSSCTGTVTVADSTSPQVTIITPQANVALQDGVTFQAQATDNCAVDKVYFYLREPDGGDGTPIGYEDLEATFNTVTGYWEYALDTTMLQDGYYVILAKAIDEYGNEGWSSVVSFSIRNWAVIELLPSTPSSKAGRTMPIKFSLRIAAIVDPTMPFVYNEDLEIMIYRCVNASCSARTLMQSSYFGTGSTDYRINGEMYITNFKTGKTPSTYVVEIWRPTKNFLVGSFTFKTTK